MKALAAVPQNKHLLDIVVNQRHHGQSCKVFQIHCNSKLVQPQNILLFSGVGLERLFTEKKNQENERRGIDICGNGEL